MLPEHPQDPDPVIEAYRKHIDRTLNRKILRLSVEERLRQLQELCKFAEEMQRACRAARETSRLNSQRFFKL